MPALLALAQQQGVPSLASRTKALHRSLAHHITDCMRALRPLPTKSRALWGHLQAGGGA